MQIVWQYLGGKVSRCKSIKDINIALLRSYEGEETAMWICKVVIEMCNYKKSCRSLALKVFEVNNFSYKASPNQLLNLN